MDRHVYQTSFASLRKKRRLFLWRWSILPYFEWFMQSSRKKRMNFLWRWIMWTTCQLKSVVSSMIEASFKGFLHSLRSVEVNMYILTVIVSTASRQLLNEAATQTWVAASFIRIFVYKNVRKCVCGLSDYLIINLNCGDGRTRTAVQTPHQTAFYTLSLPLVFDVRLPGDGPSYAYPLNLNGA